ncbi:MAG: hypothetical protein EAZ43_12525 [Betaproteobacteria bacterium]|nr:MAG: hypothetical protein EAZ43_12525 [Betaproteobacteria bacterium]
MFTDISLQGQTAYVQTVEALQSQEITRCIADVSGSFNRKIIGERSYWYYQSRLLDGRVHQTYLGPDSERLQALIDKRKSEQAERGAVPTALAQHAVKLGCEGFLPLHLRVIHKLADEGFFRAGGVLIGTHAFLAAGNSLGVRWGVGERTQDLDFAHAGKNLSVALPANAQLDLHDAIDALALGFVPANSLDGVRGGSWVHPKDPTFRLDFLTPMTRANQNLVRVPAFNAEFQALRFMEFSLEGVSQAAAISRVGEPCLVTVPDPARMAIHKLIVCGLREGGFAVKANKDLAQAASLIAFYAARSPEALAAAHADALSRGPKWRSQLNKGVALLAQRYPTQAAALA